MSKQKPHELRARTEERLCSELYGSSRGSGEEFCKILQELHNHQIELELQNEELRRVRDELMESRNQYLDLYDFAPVGYFTVDDKNLIVEANLTLTGLLGEERKALLNQPFWRFIFPEDQDIFYQHIKELIDSTEQLGCELRLLKKDGGSFWVKLESVPLAKSEQSGIRIRIAVIDITGQKRLENEIMQAKKLEATALLAGGIAHDFNNILAVILGNIEMAQEDMLLGQPVAGTLREARNACLNAGDLTKKFLTFSSGGEPLKKLIAVEDLFIDSVSLVLAGSNVNSECCFPQGLWPVEVDTGQMIQAICNVITNARESMPQGGMIRINTENVDSIPDENREFPVRQDAKYVKISIRDQGVGMAADILPRVFDPYFSSKEMGREKGLGFGLTIAYSIIKKHGGFIDIASQQNIGTTVSIYLPASDRQAVVSDKQVVSLENKNEVRQALPVNKKILFMDDDEHLRRLTRVVLERLGYEVEVVCNGEEAIQAYAKQKDAGVPFAAVILDLTIKGGLGGRETIKRLQEIDPGIRALVASGYSSDSVMSDCTKYGFLGALHKPYRIKELEKSLAALFA